MDHPKNHPVNSDPKSTDIGGLAAKGQKRTKEVDDQDEDISVDDELTEEDEEEDKDRLWYYIKRLETKEYRHDIENKKRSPNKSLISPGMVVNNYEKLNDNFLQF